MSEYNDRGEVSLVPGSLRGYRVWGPSGFALAALGFSGYIYIPGANTAYCIYAEGNRCICSCNECKVLQHDSAPAPVLACTCGFYALLTHDQEELQGAVGVVSRTYPIGSLKASGRVVLGSRGFRAERVEIEALARPCAKYVATYYGVPWFPTMEDLVAEFPPSNVDSLLKEEVAS